MSQVAAPTLATLGGGCFWCLDAALRQLRGIAEITCGYAGGQVTNPSYEAVCAGSTGHAEVVQILFDESLLPYRELLRAFFLIHDPTTLNRQGHDVGSQYRSVVFAHGAGQLGEVRQLIADLEAQALWPDPVVTELVETADGPVFWPAEHYHQDYFARNPAQPYCQAVVAPKVSKLRKAMFDRTHHP